MKQAILKDGTIVVKEASTDVSDVIAGITNARRKVEATLKDYINAKLIKAGMDSLGMDLPMKDDIGSILGGPEKAEDGLSAVISKLKDVVEELIVALEKGDAVKSDSSIDIPPKDMKDLEGEMDKGKDTIKDVKDKGPLSDMKKEEKEDEKESSEEEGAMKEAGKDSQKAMDVAMGKTGPGKKKEKGKKCAEEEESTTEVTADVTETPEIAETAPAEGEQTTETSEVTAEETEGKEVTAEEAEVSIEVEAENDEEEEDGKEKEASESESIVNKIMTRVSEMKKANLYPFKDLNKQQVDNTNATTAKDQASTINKEIKGGKQPSKADSGKAPSISPTDIKTDLKAQKGKISVEAAERIKQHSVDNAVSKARLSVELAARQQLKGLIDNPLKQACVKNMVEAGIPEATADAIVHNAFIDGYEEMQKQIIKEAFDTFMEKDIKDFIKVAEFTDSYTVKESSESPEEGEGTQVKTASASAPLRGTQVRDDRKGEYKRFWETVAYERKGGEI